MTRITDCYDAWQRTHKAARTIAPDAWDDRDRRAHPKDEARRIADTLTGWRRSQMLEVAHSFAMLRKGLIAVIAVGLVAFVPGCNMIAGIGQDLQAAARWTQERGANGFKDDGRDDYPTFRDDRYSSAR